MEVLEEIKDAYIDGPELEKELLAVVQTTLDNLLKNLRSINKMILEEKIARATEVKAYYPGPYETKYAIIEYWARREKPLKVASYYVYGEELKTGEPLYCWHWMSSTNFNIIEDNFSTEAEAITRMKELRRLRKCMT